jgi:thioredoxin reductase
VTVVGTADVVVVGGGPAGLAAARAARQAGAGRVVVVEREASAGGMPRHTHHTGFGLRDRHRVTSGPRYAAASVVDAVAAGVEVRTATTAVDWAGDTALTLATPDGPLELHARAVVLATGTRERPRSARLIPGDRPAGIHTTAAVQRLAAAGVRPGLRAVVLGAEHVSFSVIDALARAGCATVALVTPHAHHQTYAPFAWWTAVRRRVPVLAGVGVASIVGRGRVEAIVLDDGRTLTCDTVVTSGDWVPEHTLARIGGVEVDAASGAPVVDGAGRTSRSGVFAAGNVLHGALQADWCALEGAHVGRAVARHLGGARWPTPDERVALVCVAPLRWCTPGAAGTADAPWLGRVVACADAAAGRAAVVATQAGRELGRSRARTPVAPGRPFTIAAPWLARVAQDAGPVTLRLEAR